MRYTKVADIPADELIIMTPELYLEFLEGGCKPMCHLTFNYIKVGDKFKLSTLEVAVKRGSGNYTALESKEVMLCEEADVEEFKKIQEDRIYQEKKRRAEGGVVSELTEK